MNLNAPAGNTGAWKENDSPHPASIPSIRKITSFGWLKAISVSVLLILLLGGAAILSGLDKQKPIDWVHVNAINSKQNIQLPDGSKIILRKGSSLSYPSDYGMIHRIVQLKGDAYFEVMNDSGVPFSVKAINEITTDVGTSFFIRSNDSVEQVFVSDGRVRFVSSKNKDEYVVVSSGEKAVWAGSNILLSPVGDENYLSWKNEQLIFNQASLRQVADDIHNYYGVPVQVAPDIDAHQITVTARFENQPLTSILEDIGTHTGLSIKKEGDSVLVTRIPVSALIAQQAMEQTRDTTKADQTPGSVKKKKKRPFWMFWVKR